MKKRAMTLFLAAVLAGCAPAVKDKPATAPGAAEADKMMAEAAASAGRGTYLALKNACRLYGELYALPRTKKAAAPVYVQALFRLALREKEVGIPGGKPLSTCSLVVKENPTLAGWATWLSLADRIPSRVKGVVKDVALGVPPLPSRSEPRRNWEEEMKKQAEEAKKTEEDIKQRALQDEFFAYFYLARRCGSASFYDKKDDVDQILRRFPESLQIRYRAAFCPRPDEAEFKAVLEAEPEFVEVYGLLGEAALGGGNLLTAEKNILLAYEKIPESPHYAILLASIYFLTEEFERAIEFCDKAIEIVPEYRDAYLTKAIGLSYLQRYPEAIEVLNKIVAMQYYLLGESHYWLAWNYHELKDNVQAQLHIEESKGRLPTNSEVFGLAGTIALERDEIDRAEKEFSEALKYNEANTEALFGLGAVADRRSRWPDGAGFYEKAAAALVLNETSLEEKIAQIKAAPMDEARRAKMIAKKENQIRVVQATRAMAYYNAAADWANAGAVAKAVPLAEKAAAHPQFREKATDLLSRLKKSA